jgi:hypothetical protein
MDLDLRIDLPRHYVPAGDAAPKTETTGVSN